jgi:hypothetical protein
MGGWEGRRRVESREEGMGNSGGGRGMGGRGMEEGEGLRPASFPRLIRMQLPSF